MSLLDDLKGIVLDGEGEPEIITMCRMCSDCWGHYLKDIAASLSELGYEKVVWCEECEYNPTCDRQITKGCGWNDGVETLLYCSEGKERGGKE